MSVVGIIVVHLSKTKLQALGNTTLNKSLILFKNSGEIGSPSYDLNNGSKAFIQLSKWSVAFSIEGSR